MEKVEFFNVENLDGYISGILFLYCDGRRFIFEFGYDVEFSSLKLLNCNNVLYNSYSEEYSLDEISQIYMEQRGFIIEEIKNRLN